MVNEVDAAKQKIVKRRYIFVSLWYTATEALVDIIDKKNP